MSDPNDLPDWLLELIEDLGCAGVDAAEMEFWRIWDLHGKLIDALPPPLARILPPFECEGVICKNVLEPIRTTLARLTAQQKAALCERILKVPR